MIECIIDCDPGIDDALALIFASKLRTLKIKAITTVFGNSTVENTSLNALKILDLIHRTDIRVYRGSASPIIKNYRFPAYNYLDDEINPHGANGLANIVLPQPTQKLSESNAIDLIINTILENPKRISIIAIGPLTNIAIALLKSPEIAQSIKEIIIMGGAIKVQGNINKFSEFNIWSDAEAAKIVFNMMSDKIILVPLDVTRQIIFKNVEIFNKNNLYNKFLYNILNFYSTFHLNNCGFFGSILHDPFAVGVAENRDYCDIREIPLDVEIEDRNKYGKVFINLEKDKENKKIKTCLNISLKNIEKFLNYFEKKLLNF
ncbi:MAG: nucleoside hydrolase [Candidatus Helarchaeota archaeon]